MAKTTTDLLPPPMTMTVTQQKRKKRDRAMLECYVKLMKEEPSRSRTLLNDYLMRRFRLASTSAYYEALARAAADPDTPRQLAEEYERFKNAK